MLFCPDAKTGLARLTHKHGSTLPLAWEKFSAYWLIYRSLHPVQKINEFQLGSIMSFGTRSDSLVYAKNARLSKRNSGLTLVGLGNTAAPTIAP